MRIPRFQNNIKINTRVSSVNTKLNISSHSFSHCDIVIYAKNHKLFYYIKFHKYKSTTYMPHFLTVNTILHTVVSCRTQITAFKFIRRVSYKSLYGS